MSEIKVKLFYIKKGKQVFIPVAEEKYPAGFPKTVSNNSTKKIDLNEELIKNPSSTFFGQIEGDSLEDIGLFNNDYFLIDRSLVNNIQNGMLILGVLDAEFTIKFLEITKDKKYILLNPANQEYKPIIVNEFIDFKIWGVITYGIKDILKNYRFGKMK